MVGFARHFGQCPPELSQNRLSWRETEAKLVLMRVPCTIGLNLQDCLELGIELTLHSS